MPLSSSARKSRERTRMERASFLDEMLHFRIYENLAHIEKDPELKALLVKLYMLEKKHMNLWKAILNEDAVSVPSIAPAIVRLNVLSFMLIRKVMGVGFVTKVLSITEGSTLEGFSSAIKSVRLPEREMHNIHIIMRDENYTEEELKDKIRQHEGELNYIRSIVLGLNDGLVEVLAAVAGFAVLASSNIVVIIGSSIIGISGTLSMAGGMYLSSKSHGLIKRGNNKSLHEAKPAEEALYTGAYYLLGAFIPILPFLLGVSGYAGIVASIILVSLVLIIVSTIIAITSSTSIKERIFEMLAISLGASFATLLLSSIARFYFHITI